MSSLVQIQIHTLNLLLTLIALKAINRSSLILRSLSLRSLPPLLLKHYLVALIPRLMRLYLAPCSLLPVVIDILSSTCWTLRLVALVRWCRHRSSSLPRTCYRGILLEVAAIEVIGGETLDEVLVALARSVMVAVVLLD